MNDITGPLIAVGGVVFGAVITNFLGEDYRRHRDGTALAAAFAGELFGHFGGSAMLNPALQHLRDKVSAGTIEDLTPRTSIEKVSDLIFEANAGKIGLLGTEHARAVAYAYQRISSFRTSLNTLVDHWNTMDKAERLARLDALITLLDDVATKGAETIAGLETYASSGNLRGWIRTFAIYRVIANSLSQLRG